MLAKVYAICWNIMVLMSERTSRVALKPCNFLWWPTIDTLLKEIQVHTHTPSFSLINLHTLLEIFWIRAITSTGSIFFQLDKLWVEHAATASWSRGRLFSLWVCDRGWEVTGHDDRRQMAIAQNRFASQQGREIVYVTVGRKCSWLFKRWGSKREG